MQHYFFSKCNVELQNICADILGTPMGQLYYITGRAGMGKTTFLKHLKEQLEEEGKTVILLDSSDFRCLHMDAVCVRNKVTEFIEQMCSCDVLELDNIEDLSSPGVLSSLLTIMTKIKNKGGYIVFTSMKSLHELDFMGERIRSLLDESIVAGLDEPEDEELRSFLSFLTGTLDATLSDKERLFILDGCISFAHVKGRFLTWLAHCD